MCWTRTGTFTSASTRTWSVWSLLQHKYDVSLLKDLIREHVELTGSPRGRHILDNFGEYLPKFKKVLPHDYDKMLRLIAQMEEKGEDSEQAQMEAFYAMKNTK